MSDLLTIQHELDRLAAEHGATYVDFKRLTRPDGSPFYSVDLHFGNIVRGDHGDTLAEALTKALADEGINTTPKQEAA